MVYLTDMKTTLLLSLLISVLLLSCSAPSPLDYALEQAGSNRPELEKVLDHYKSDPEKLSAAQFLIENMPAHLGVLAVIKYGCLEWIIMEFSLF